MLKFTYIPNEEDESPVKSLEVTLNEDITWYQILEVFKPFLEHVSYRFKGNTHFGLVDNDTGIEVVNRYKQKEY